MFAPSASHLAAEPMAVHNAIPAVWSVAHRILLWRTVGEMLPPLPGGGSAGVCPVCRRHLACGSDLWCRKTGGRQTMDVNPPSETTELPQQHQGNRPTITHHRATVYLHTPPSAATYVQLSMGFTFVLPGRGGGGQSHISSKKYGWMVCAPYT